ncbi:phage baseplate assembly protein W [Sphingomonas kyeonggiensis]|uniref:GPW/gp25 family protein n=1 Tax=Sphingomonas kyeonggiensis TaxID=1268553 RepID=UPI00278374C6|nr:GPW/gp25 family protein [Sphingomonas kyeonggiensis]MDQ0250956.1 phage baseplate assembly protein W [Sphingomonas kyeonggiensis]
MDRETGKRLSGLEHLAQSITDILTTPIGSRLMRRDYGSAVFELIDQAMNALGRLRLIAAIADAIRRWEPRIRLTRVTLTGEAAEFAGGRFGVDLEGELTEAAGVTGLARLSIPLRPASS